MSKFSNFENDCATTKTAFTNCMANTMNKSRRKQQQQLANQPTNKQKSILSCRILEQLFLLSI